MKGSRFRWARARTRAAFVEVPAVSSISVTPRPRKTLRDVFILASTLAENVDAHQCLPSKDARVADLRGRVILQPVAELIGREFQLGRAILPHGDHYFAWLKVIEKKPSSEWQREPGYDVRRHGLAPPAP